MSTAKGKKTVSVCRFYQFPINHKVQQNHGKKVRLSSK